MIRYDELTDRFTKQVTLLDAKTLQDFQLRPQHEALKRHSEDQALLIGNLERQIAALTNKLNRLR